MKIFRICPEPPHLRKFRKFHRANLMHRPYAEQMALYRKENIVLPGGWAAAMEAEGCEVFETVYGDSALQVRWAIENDHCALLSQSIMQQLVLKEMVRAFDPDVIFFYGGAFFRFPPDLRNALRSCCSKKVILTGLWGDELPHGLTYKDYFRGMDFIFCSSKAYEQKFEKADIPALTIGNCFDDTIEHAPAPKKIHPFIFSGTTGYGYPDHIGRYEKIIELMRKTDLEIWANEPNLLLSRLKNFALKPFHLRLRIKVALINIAACLPYLVLRGLKAFSPVAALRYVANWAAMCQEGEVSTEVLLDFKPAHPSADYFRHAKSLRQLFPRRVHQLLMNASDYYTLTESAQIVINLHRDEDADIGNIRCYEVTGLGSVLVTDRGKELADFFEPDVDFVAFKTIDECIEKINYLLAHPNELERIARNGQAKTRSCHTVRHRCRQIVQKLQELIDDPAVGNRGRRSVVDATYNLNHHPISYDISFFLQAAEIYRKQNHADSLRITIVWPEDIHNVPGVSKKADAAVGAAARAFRINHICGQMAELMDSDGVIHVRSGKQSVPLIGDNVDVLPYPVERDHHTVYYRKVMSNPELMTGFSASADANRYIREWLAPLLRNRKVLTVTLRQYKYDVERNSNIKAWTDFLGRVDSREYAVVVVPDTDHIEDFSMSTLGCYSSFLPVCFDVDLRLALYEQAFLNMFINNGPCVAATLDKNVNYLLFKLLAPSVPHCTEEFLRWSGFEIGGNPSYAGPYQKWIWEEDEANVIWREFVEMRNKIQDGGWC